MEIEIFKDGDKWVVWWMSGNTFLKVSTREQAYELAITMAFKHNGVE